ncbi:MAG: S-adenosylmethionine:tRNA ribosyltransferase-isomerase [Alistipes ihumii]
MERNIRISDYDYPLPEGRIAKFPLERREQSKLLVCRDGRIAEDRFERIGRFRPRFDARIQQHESDPARLIFHKATGAHRNILSRAARPRRLRARLCRATAAGNASSAI